MAMKEYCERVVKQRHDVHGDQTKCRNVTDRLGLHEEGKGSGKSRPPSTSAHRLSVSQRVEDKTAVTRSESSCQRFALPRSITKSVSLVQTLVWHGAMHSPCVRLHGQYKEDPLESNADLQHGDCFLIGLTHWHVRARCVFHLAHGGLPTHMVGTSLQRRWRSSSLFGASTHSLKAVCWAWAHL